MIRLLNLWAYVNALYQFFGAAQVRRNAPAPEAVLRIRLAGHRPSGIAGNDDEAEGDNVRAIILSVARFGQ